MRKVGLSGLISKVVNKVEPYDQWGIIAKIRKKRQGKVPIAENERLDSAPPVIMDWPINIKKPYVGLVLTEEGQWAYWPKFERFLISNDIPYEAFDIKRSNFISECKKFDIIVWRTRPDYASQWEATDKIELMQDQMGKIVLPTKESLWMYEDKVRQQWLLEMNNLPTIKTFISYSLNEALQFIKNCDYPFVSKNRTCSSSKGVHLIKNKRQARKLCYQIFNQGLTLPESYIKQKNYVYFQEFVPNQGFDLRVIIVGNSYFGYYRLPRKGDYRASGSGITHKREIPQEALLLAKKVKNCLPKTHMLAVDFLQDIRDNQYYIIETSIFIRIETSEQLVVNGVPGRYIEHNEIFTFEEGRFWLQELMMLELMKEWIVLNSEGSGEIIE